MIDFRDLFKCNDIGYKERKLKALRKLFYQRTYTLSCKKIDDTFDDVIDEIISLLLNVKQLKDAQVAKIAIAMLIEDIIFTVINDTQYMHIIIALYNL